MQSKEREEMEMTLDELKAEADMQGYRLVKKNNPPRLSPCTCGGRRRSWWCRSGPDGNFYYLICEKCGKKSEYGKNKIEVSKKWNEMMESEMKNV